MSLQIKYQKYKKLLLNNLNKYENTLTNNLYLKNQIEVLNMIDELNEYMENIINEKDNTYKLSNLQELYFNKEILPKIVFMHVYLK